MVGVGLDRLIEEEGLRKGLKGRIAYLGHAASVSLRLVNGLDEIAALFGNRLVRAFGPQHGFGSVVQDNMIESDHFMHPVHSIPVYSLYGETRKPSDEMLDGIDTLIVDLQDVGTRVYTYIWTLYLAMEACLGKHIRIVILDRPNPIGGEQAEGIRPEAVWYSFVCLAPIPMRHGLTIGEMALFFKTLNQWDLDVEVIRMTGWNRKMTWPETGRPWVNPSPNLPTPEGTLVYPGSVMIEGTTLSEGRGTTRSLEQFGHPDLDPWTVKKDLDRYLTLSGQSGFVLRPVWFQPTFHKFTDKTVGGFHIHVTNQDLITPWALMIHILKYLYHASQIRPFWNDQPYEYQFNGLSFDWIHGTTQIREWIEDPGPGPFPEDYRTWAAGFLGENGTLYE